MQFKLFALPAYLLGSNYLFLLIIYFSSGTEIKETFILYFIYSGNIHILGKFLFEQLVTQGKIILRKIFSGKTRSRKIRSGNLRSGKTHTPFADILSMQL